MGARFNELLFAFAHHESIREGTLVTALKYFPPKLINQGDSFAWLNKVCVFKLYELSCIIELQAFFFLDFFFLILIVYKTSNNFMMVI